jgi:hypothetical protein
MSISAVVLVIDHMFSFRSPMVHSLGYLLCGHMRHALFFTSPVHALSFCFPSLTLMVLGVLLQIENVLDTPRQRRFNNASEDAVVDQRETTESIEIDDICFVIANVQNGLNLPVIVAPPSPFLPLHQRTALDAFLHRLLFV